MKSKKQKKLFVMIFIMLLLLMTLTACGGSSNTGSSETTNDDSQSEANEQVYTMKIASVIGEGNFIAIGFEKFKELVEEKSDGRIKVEIYLNGTLAASSEEEVQLIQDGTIDMIGMNSYLGASVGGVNGFNIYDFPFLYEDRDALYGLMEGPFGQGIQAEFEEATGTKVLGYYDIGSMSLLNSKRTIKQPSDLKGLSIRTPEGPLFMDTISAMGGNPTPITFAEVYTSLQQGAIDGLTTTLPLMYDSQFYEVSKYITLTKHHFIPYVATINKEFFEGLPEDLQAIVEEAADEYIQFSRNLVEEHEVTVVENLKAEGVEIYELSPEELAAFKEAVQPAIDKNIDLVGEETYQRALEELNQ